MTGTVTWVGFDVHARSAHGAAIDLVSGEVRRMRFGAGVEGPIAWLGDLPGPVRACYEAGPTGFGLYRAAVAAGIRMDVIAPGKTPRGRGDRVKTDRKDAELLARLLLAGQLTAIAVPPIEIEAARGADPLPRHVSARSQPSSPPGLEDAVAPRAGVPGAFDLEPEAPVLAGPAAVRSARQRAGIRQPARRSRRAERSQTGTERAPLPPRCR